MQTFFLFILFLFTPLFSVSAKRIVLGNPSTQYWLWVDETGKVRKDDDAVSLPSKKSLFSFFTDDLEYEKEFHLQGTQRKHKEEVFSLIKKISDYEEQQNNSIKKKKRQGKKEKKKNKLGESVKKGEFGGDEEIFFTRALTNGGENDLENEDLKSEERKNNLYTEKFVKEENEFVTFTRSWTGKEYSPKKEVITYKKDDKKRFKYIEIQGENEIDKLRYKKIYEFEPIQKKQFNDEQFPLVHYSESVFYKKNINKYEKKTDYIYEYTKEGGLAKIKKNTQLTKNTILQETNSEIETYNYNEKKQEMVINYKKKNSDNDEIYTSKNVYSYNFFVDEKSKNASGDFYKNKEKIYDNSISQREVTLKESFITHTVNTRSNTTNKKIEENMHITYSFDKVKNISKTTVNKKGDIISSFVQKNIYSDSGVLQKTTKTFMNEKGIQIKEVSYYDNPLDSVPSKKEYIILNKWGEKLKEIEESFLYTSTSNPEINKVNRVIFDRKGEIQKNERFQYIRNEKGEVTQKKEIIFESGMIVPRLRTYVITSQQNKCMKKKKISSKDI